MEARQGIVEEGAFDINEYADELGRRRATSRGSHDVVRERPDQGLGDPPQPGDRGAFHSHVTNYFWTVVEGSRGLQRFADGTFIIRDYLVGETKYLEHTPDTALIHDLENVGSSPLRFVTSSCWADRAGRLAEFGQSGGRQASATACIDSGESSETWISGPTRCIRLRERRRRRT